MGHIIETDKLTKNYGKSRGIEDVTLQVAEGEVYGFIGPNGAGKSTAIRTLLNLIFPSSGTAKIFGLDTRTEHERIMGRLGYLPGDVDYYGTMTAQELLSYSASYYGSALGTRYNDLCERFQLNTSKPFRDLSMGNKKKVAIIQAVLHQPDLLILDEPTNGLDPLMQSEFFKLLEEENKRGVTVFLSSHILADVERQCTKVSVIKEGRVIATEDMSTLMEQQMKVISLQLSDGSSGINSDWAGVSDVQQHGDRITFNYKGDVKDLLILLQRIEPVDLSVQQPTLEQVFMHYYES